MPPVDPHVVVDQFGYLTDSEKIAVIRDPQTGYDAAESFVPGGTYALVNATTRATATSGTPVAWNGGRLPDNVHALPGANRDKPGCSGRP